MLSFNQKEWVKNLYRAIPKNSDSVKDLKLARDINREGSKEYWNFSNTTDIWVPIDHHSILDNMLVFDFDNDSREKNYENCKKIAEFLKEEYIPYIITDHSGRSPHIYVFFSLDLEIFSSGDVSYRLIRKILYEWILFRVGIEINADTPEIDFSPLHYDEEHNLRGGHLIRAIGGRYFKNGDITYNSFFSEIPEPNNAIKSPNQVKFPKEIEFWKISKEGFEEIKKALWTKKEKEEKEKSKKKKNEEVSFFEDAGSIYEQIIDPNSKECKFAVWDGRNLSYVDKIEFPDRVLIPINDEGIKEGAVLLPSKAEDFNGLDSLINELRSYIHSYLDISEEFEIFAVYYILLSWVYDKVNTLPYLRALGDTGTGKSRFLDVIGRLCYKPCIVSGAITPAPIYRMIKKWHGTIILDEADFRDSSEKNEVITILNCGFERGRPVIRCNKDKPNELEFLPTFCPKVLSTRYTFNDKALESRCLTEKLKETDRKDIPPLLPLEFYEKEQKLRNKLLMFRFKWRDKIDQKAISKIDLGEIEPRLKQATSSFAVLFSNIPELMEKFKRFLERYNRELIEERATTTEGMIVNTIFSLKNQGFEEISSKDISVELEKEGISISPQMIGKYLKTLGINTERKSIEGLMRRYILWNEELMEKLRRRYVPENLFFTNGRSPYTNVNNVINVSSYHLTNMTSLTNDMKDIRSKIQVVNNLILEKIQNSEDGLVEEEKIVEDVSKVGIERDLAKEILDSLKNKGIIFEPKKGKIKFSIGIS